MMGEIWLTAEEFYRDFKADGRCALLWRSQGMPYGRTETGEYIYPKYACHAWHAGVDGQNGDTNAEEEKVHFYQRKVPVL